MKRIIIFSLALIFLTLIITYLTAQNVDLKFSHKYHMKEVETACDDCHDAATSMSAQDNLLPDMDKCYSCHDEEETECTVCHKDPDNAEVYPRIVNYIDKFPHKKHIEQSIPCEKCHAGVDESDNIMEKHLPNMAVCSQCHRELAKTDFCYDCHKKGMNLKPANHDGQWKANHAYAAVMDKEQCTQCHTDNSCNECHSSDNLDRKVHPLNFVNNHAIYAKGNTENCYTCHEELSFCVDCHRERMVMPRNHAFANWSNTTTGGAHARAARLDMDSCLSCHSDTQGDPVCVVCHQ